MELKPRDAQRTYARWLDLGAKAGFAVMVVGFAAYLFGLLPAHVPVEQLPALWSLPLGEYLARTATPTGWGWVALLARGEYPGIAGIALLSGCSAACLLAVAIVYARRGERAYVVICIVEIVVLLLAASGLLTAGH